MNTFRGLARDFEARARAHVGMHLWVIHQRETSPLTAHKFEVVSRTFSVAVWTLFAEGLRLIRRLYWRDV